jgi:hypothetical protein
MIDQGRGDIGLEEALLLDRDRGHVLERDDVRQDGVRDDVLDRIVAQFGRPILSLSEPLAIGTQLGRLFGCIHASTMRAKPGLCQA